MICPNCETPRFPVEETRSTPDVIWRVRKCGGCGWRVTTKETYAPDDEQSIPQKIRKPKTVKTP